MENRPETGSYILRSLLKDVAVSTDESASASITCVELWDDNLYIGTSAGEILHHVRILSDPSDQTGQPTFILASRLQPPSNQSLSAGIQQILLLPSVGKACVLCNNTLSFYSLPELSPALNIPALTCGWVGGVDLDHNVAGDSTAAGGDGVVIMMCLRSKIRLVKVAADKALKIRDIEFAGCLAAVRRGDFACVADARSYALLDVVHQQKIPLFSISSVDDQPAENAGTVPDDVWSQGVESLSRSGTPLSSTRSALAREERGHRKSSSLGIFQSRNFERVESDSSTRRGSLHRPVLEGAASFPKSPLPRRVSSPDESITVLPDVSKKPLPPPPGNEDPPSRPASVPPSKTYIPLRPLITSPTPDHFLLVIGTAPTEPGVGMFVNLDGEVDRGTIEFTSFPEALVVDGKRIDIAASQVLEGQQEEGHVLAVVRREVEGDLKYDVEIQRFDVESGEEMSRKEWLGMTSVLHYIGESGELASDKIGIRTILAKSTMCLPEIIKKLALKSVSLPPTAEMQFEAVKVKTREKEEESVINGLCNIDVRTTLWKGNEVFWLFKNPTVLKLDSRLRLAQYASTEEAKVEPQRELIERLINEIRGSREAPELEFFSLAYIRQKAALLLFMDLVKKTMSGTIVPDAEKRSTGEILVDSKIDPRIILAFLPLVNQDILQGETGVWVFGGLKELMDAFFRQHDLSHMPADPLGIFGMNLLELSARFLLFWRQKKDNPSVTDREYVSPSVDAAVIHILLVLDTETPRGPATAGSPRMELNAVVDSGVECFERAIELLEKFKRLYVLSRLYQSKKMSSKVLSTWKRIISGEEDAGGEFVDGEQELRKYLSKMRDGKLVVEYGTWLAARNPKLGVQVFADEHSKVVIPPAEALSILRENAPNAVKDYLEYLVFTKKQPQHINELLFYYLDIVLNELTTSPASHTHLTETYTTYRALMPPKPTYRQFITDNAIASSWWQSRLRLLQLLGSNQGPASSYDVAAILDRLAPHGDALVPEMIILNGRQGRHQEALRLLVHGLGDFDTAISYCLLGGGSIFRPPGGVVESEARPSHEEQAGLFEHLLHEFLAIGDEESRIERTGELLERFGAWFDPAKVLALLPDDWAVEVFSGFLVRTLQRLVREKRETGMARVLNAAVNLRVSEEFVEKIREAGPVIEGRGGII